MNDDILMTSGTPVIKHVSTIHLSLKATRVSLAFLIILVISVGSLKHALLVENLVVNYFLSSAHPSMLPPGSLMFAGILNSGPTNSIILRILPTEWKVRSSTLLKLRRIGDTLPRPLYSFTIDLRADRYPSICFLAKGAILMRGVLTFSIGSLPEVDPPVLSVIPAGVAPMVSSGVPLRYSYSGGTRDLRVPEIYETNALASSWGSPKTKLRRIYTRLRNSVGTLFLHCARTLEHGVLSYI
ncbi:hypothetical protein Tco_1564530 [Tanacetum coccineum]